MDCRITERAAAASALRHMPLFYSDHALIVDEAGSSVETMMKSA